MAVESWIDALVARWATVSDNRGGHVHAYRVYDKADWPDAIGHYPSALTYTTEDRSYYSLGGPGIDQYRGITEFHLFPNVNKGNYPELMLYFARIRNAAAGAITLGGLVAHFLLRTDLPSIQGPVTLQYGGEDPHHGLIVNWEVKESVNDDAGFAPAA